MRWRNRLILGAYSGILISNLICPLSINAQELEVSNVQDTVVDKDIIPISEYHRPKTKMKPEYITIHNTANNAEGADADMHSIYLKYNEDTYVSWHFTVDDKKIVEHLPIDEVGYHAGDDEGKGNATSIGIEICENADGDYAQAEKNAIPLVVELLIETGLTPDKVVPHQHWTGKNCPQNMLEKTDGSMGWEAFVSLVQKEYMAKIEKAIESRTKNTLEEEKAKIYIQKGKSATLGLYATEKKPREFYLKDKNIELQTYKKECISLYAEQDIQPELLTIGIDEESRQQDFMNLWLDKEVKKTESQILNKQGEIKKEGVETIRFTKKGNTYTFLVHAYNQQAPTILTDKQVFFSSGNPSILLQSSSFKYDWKIDNSEIIEIKDGVITGKKEGETTISTVIDGKLFTQTVIVEVK